MQTDTKFFGRFILTAFFGVVLAAANAPAATFTATNTQDFGAGSLRQAIIDANATAGTDIINFDQSFNEPRTINLTSGQLLITNGGGITINGPGTHLLTISGNNQSRVFEINDTNGTLAMAAVFNNFTISNAALLSADLGDGVSIGMNNGNAVNPSFLTELTLNNVRIVNVTAPNQGYGNVFCRRSGTVTINNSYVGNNLASPIRSGSGGGSCQLTIANSTIEKNSGGDGLIVAGNTAVTNSTINDNVVHNNGSAFRIALAPGGSFNLTNTTIVRNRSNGSNSAAVLFFGSALSSVANLTSVIIAQNFSASNNSPAGLGVYDGAGTINLKNTIIADNFKPAGSDDFYVSPGGNYVLNSTYNLVEKLSNILLNGQPTQAPSAASGNLVGVDPLLDGALRNYGGATKTLALRRGSPAIDRGDPGVFSPTDQRGIARPQDGDGDGAARSDMGAYERRPIDVIQSRVADFDNDGADDVSVFRPSNGTWYLQQSALGLSGAQFGATGDVITPADFDGDGRTDLAVYRNGIWYLNRSSSGFTGISFGQTGDIPAPGDYDGDEKADVAVFRPSNGTWYLLQSTAGFAGVQFGQNGDKAVAADYDGDGKSDIAVNRNGTWFINRSSLGFTGIQFGDGNDRPTPADYDGDGRADVAVFRPSNGTWYLQRSQLGFTGVSFGQTGDSTAPADYDGDGRLDVAVFRSGVWFLNRSTNGFTGVSFGAASDLPVPNAFVR